MGGLSLVSVGDGKLVRREERDDLGTARRHDDFLLDACGGHPVRRRAVRLDGEHHARLQLHRVVEGVETTDDRALVEAETDAVAEVETEGGHLAVEADLLRLRKRTRDLVGRHARLDERDRLVHPLARLLVGDDLDRKSTRLNSSHMSISYAVFCLKKKKKKNKIYIYKKKKNKKKIIITI